MSAFGGYRRRRLNKVKEEKKRVFSIASGCRSFVAGCVMTKKKRSCSVKCAEMRVLLERLINKYSLAYDKEAILLDGKETRASFM